MSAASTSVGRQPRPTRAGLIAGLLGAVVISGCSAAMHAPSAPAASPNDLTPAAMSQQPTSSGRLATRSADDRDNGSTILLRLGQQLVLSLGDDAVGGTYWQIFEAQPGGVVRGGPVTVHPEVERGQVAGSGFGTVVQEFTAVSVGRTGVTAQRTTCGEAMRCSHQQATFAITIVVTDRP